MRKERWCDLIPADQHEHVYPALNSPDGESQLRGAADEQPLVAIGVAQRAGGQ